MAMRRVSKIAAHVIAPQVTSAGDGEPLVDPKEGTRYQCGICKHIYRPDKDGGGVAFEDREPQVGPMARMSVERVAEASLPDHSPLV